MGFSKDLIINWDKEMDVMNVARQGVDLDVLVNVDSKKVPGIVKRIDPQTGECVGFIIDGFSQLFPRFVDCDEAVLQNLLSVSLELSSDCATALKSA